MDKILDILQATNDGNDLAPRHLYLLEVMMNSNVFDVTEHAEHEFDRLYEKVMSGHYDKLTEYIHGIEHLTRDHEGYIYWKGKRVEHYSYDDAQAEKAAAQHLANRCRKLDDLGIPVTMRTATDDQLLELTANDPWLPMVLSLYTVMEDSNGVTAVLFSSAQWDVDVVLRGTNENRKFTVKQSEFDSGHYRAFHMLQDTGFTSTWQYGSSYRELINRLAELGFSPEDFATAMRS